MTTLLARKTVNGKVFSFDEIDFAGFFVTHGGLEVLVNFAADKIQLAYTYSDAFDKMYGATQGGPLFKFKVTEPVITNLSERFARVAPPT